MGNTTIQLKKSGTAANVPAALEYGEIAINYADGLLYYKNVNNYIVSFSSGGPGGSSYGTVNANGTLIVSAISGDVFKLISGAGINITADAPTDTITIASTLTGMDYAYANTIGASSNGWANTITAAVGVSSNAWANTKVASVTGTAAQIFSSGGVNPTLNLISTAVAAGTYGGTTQIPVVIVDAFGRLTSVANVAVNGMDYPYANTIGAASNNWANTVGVNATAVANGWANTVGINVGAVSNGWANTISTAIGVSSNAWANTKVSSVSGTAAQIFSSGGVTPTLNLISTAVTASTYGSTGKIPVITIDAFGRITSAANATVSLSPFVSFTSNVGNASANVFVIAHNLNFNSIYPMIREYSSGYFVYPDVKLVDANTIQLEFVNAPTANQYFLTVLGG